jgi:hypothetical protein
MKRRRAAISRRHRKGGASDSRRCSVDARRSSAAVFGRVRSGLRRAPLCRAEANQFFKELEGLLLREAIEEPNESDLIGKAEPVMRAQALAKLHKIFLAEGGGALELIAGKHYRCDIANAEVPERGFLSV